jgi:hypothetical protein
VSGAFGERLLFLRTSSSTFPLLQRDEDDERDQKL